MAWENPKTNWGQSGQTVPGVDDFNRIEGNIAVLGQYDRAPGYGVAPGENAKVITLNPAPGSYYDGLCFAFKNETQNTGAVTINVNGMGARPLKKPNGSDVVTGYLKAGSIYTVRYNAATENFILQGSDSTGNATPADVLAGKTFSNDNDTGIVGTMPDRGAISQIITNNNKIFTIPQGYHNGQGTVSWNMIVTAGNEFSIVDINARREIPNSYYVEARRARIDVSGSVRVGFNLGISTVYNGISNRAYARIFINNIAVGTERTYSYQEGGATSFTEDFNVNTGDIITLKLKTEYVNGYGNAITDIFNIQIARPNFGELLYY